MLSWDWFGGTVAGMLVVRCTAKLRTAVGETELGDVPGHNALDSWHANLFYWRRRKCVMLVNDRTLLPVLLFGLKKPQIESLPAVFTERFCSLLDERRVPGYIVGKVRRLYELGLITKTTDRSVAGSLVEFTKELKWAMEDGDLSDPEESIDEVDDFLWGRGSLRLPEFHPAEALTGVYLQRFVERGRPGLDEAREVLRVRSRLR